MRVGLVRHFPVTEPWPGGWPTAAELQAWRVRYDAAEPLPGPLDVAAATWQRCWSSDLKRAVVTAQAAYAGPIESMPLLREVGVPVFATGPLRLPVWGWRLLWRLAWWTGHPSQRAARDEFLGRIATVADRLEAEGLDTLVVSHAGVMVMLQRELRRRGFRGPRFGLPDHGRLHVLERG